ncbi:hypothetical protein [Porphyromonas sp. COT-052 OH4946]|uniref:hypothetical protein n=1 Tax=Porphyromonas sp. COT-052 OH4946 TaxID=1515618 RepID=UPI001F276886|nr:hypothetical protein [Porphyromonas sp. COT-052 OH4946]
MVVKNVARDFFRFGSGMKNFSRQNENVLARVFSNCGAAIRAFVVRVFSVQECAAESKGNRKK